MPVPHFYIGLEILSKPLTIAVLKITWKLWSRSMKIDLKGLAVSFAPMSKRLWKGIWIAAISLTALPESNAKTAAMTSHIPDQREQMVCYYGFYSNVSRGLRQKENEDDLIPCVLKPDENKKPNRNWARLIQKKGACPGLDPGK
jgi:hypothetical protein